jgi:maltose alpha-D-glucosyltransferase/alpha-amylase
VGRKEKMPSWLNDAVFYEIYPQSFYDTNGDGIGDLQGIIEKLDYIKSIGCNALWINPMYDSPFKDAGYDVRDYKKVAPRYGTNEDARELFSKAHEKGIKVLLDLVPGHTSEEHEWFKKSMEPDRNEYSDRYVWTDGAFCGIKDHLYVSGESDRDGVYMLNFFKCQPALNYGWGKVTEKWQTPAGEGEAVKTKEAMKDVMRFWLDMGCDGFRVDMADSLVKDDDEIKSNTQAIWKDVRKMLDSEYPDAAMVSEWSNPECALNGGFHMDFYLDHWENGYNALTRDYEPNGFDNDNSYFKADAKHDINRFLKDYLPKYEKTKDLGFISFMTCNHDTPRPRRTLSEDELKVMYSFIFSMPGVPFLYYGDEIGMNYRILRSKEGGYQRTGSRTPMQWNGGKNLGFSDCEKEKLYLPIDDRNPVNVETALKTENSLLSVVKKIVSLRHSEDSLKASADFEVVFAEKEKPFAFRRGDLICVVNPSNEAAAIDNSVEKMLGERIYSIREGEESNNIISGSEFYIYRAK